MAATQGLSPGGALLRSSRMFAIPAPLPKPRGNYTSGSIFASDTATTPYPTHLAITTPPSSLARGDWGLKRPLPLRSTTNTSTPILKVTTMDTFEHVTEFTTAAAHTLTLQKWQGLHLPLTTPPTKTNYSNVDSILGANSKACRSVFEADIDYTAPRELKVGEKDGRWKFNGPWLGGQTEMEFQNFLKRVVRNRKIEFTKFLRKEYVHEYNAKIAEQARGRDGPSPITFKDVTEEEFRAYVKELRTSRTKLFLFIRQFLDIPPSQHLSETERMENEYKKDGQINLIGTKVDVANPYAITGPPKTHPSAGLSYVRTAAYIQNHPLFGPQEHKTPVKGRVVMPKNAAVGSAPPLLGVAGYVVNLPSDATVGFNRNALWQKSSSTVALPPTLNLEIDATGGSKVWLHAKSASLNPKSMVQLVTTTPREMSVNIAEGKAWKPDSTSRGDFNNRTRGGFSMQSQEGYRRVPTGLDSNDVFGENPIPRDRGPRTMDMMLDALDN